MNIIFTFLLLFNIHEMNPQARQEKPLFSFGVVADVQYADLETAGSRYYRSSTYRLKEAYDAFRDDSVSFVINLGDLIDGNFESYKPVMDIIKSSGILTYHVTGNHDYAVEENMKKRLPQFSEHKEGYYSFTAYGFRFIVLDGNEISLHSGGGRKITEMAGDYIESLKSSGEPNAMEWNGGISSTQLKWLRDQLDKSSKVNEKVFILCHFPVYPVNAHNLFNYKEVNQLLQNYRNIVAWFAGHNHAGNYGNFNMIHFITFRGMVESQKNSFATVDVYSNKLWINGYGREKSQILEY